MRASDLGKDGFDGFGKHPIPPDFTKRTELAQNLGELVLPKPELESVLETLCIYLAAQSLIRTSNFQSPASTYLDAKRLDFCRTLGAHLIIQEGIFKENTSEQELLKELKNPTNLLESFLKTQRENHQGAKLVLALFKNDTSVFSILRILVQTEELLKDPKGQLEYMHLACREQARETAAQILASLDANGISERYLREEFLAGYVQLLPKKVTIQDDSFVLKSRDCTVVVE